MVPFMEENFLLTTSTAKKLFRVAETMPIVDYHCHVSPKEIYEDKHFDNLYQVWLSGDHYKWRLMRSNGIEERYITGDASDWEKFLKFSQSLPKAIGNPMYHWCHLELQRFFGYRGVLNGDTAKEVWDLTADVLKNKNLSVREMIRKSNVSFIGTTDDPADSLEWHQKIANDPTMKTVVAPSFRPDKALNIDKNGWKDYIESLSIVAGIEIKDLNSLKTALRTRMDFFAKNGCKASDHGLDYMVYRPAEESVLNDIIAKGLSGVAVTAEEAEMLKTNLLQFCAAEYVRLNWVMQIHYNCLRNPNSRMFENVGPDTGFDCIGPNNGSVALANFLDSLYRSDTLPRTVLYSLDGSDNAFLDALIGSFQGSEVPGKIQHGSAWWFNDHKQGMKDQLISLANLSLLGNFIGMLTDSRSFLSYTRHEYFRRILCDLIGNWVERGEYPNDDKTLTELIQDICYNNAARYFNLED